MNHYELLLTHMGTVLHLQYLVPLLVGTIAGVIGGALPGVTITMTVIVVLPFTFGLDPLQGLAAMIGVYVGGSAGGSITASLIGIPGTPSAVATTFDGFPMTKKGEAGRSVWVGVTFQRSGCRSPRAARVSAYAGCEPCSAASPALVSSAVR